MALSPQRKQTLMKAMLFFIGFFLGVFYIPIWFGSSSLLFYQLFSNGLEGKSALILLAFLCVVGTPVFFVLSYLVGVKMKAGRLAFPIGSFLCADTVLVLIPVLDLMNPERLLSFAGNIPEKAKIFAYSVLILVVTLVLLVICWLISVLFIAFKRFQAISFQPPATVSPATPDTSSEKE